MSTNVNANVLKNFIVDMIGGNKIDKYKANSVGIKENKYEEANVDENAYLDLDEIMDDADLVAMFTVKYEDMLAEKNNEPDKEKEKEKTAQVQDKNGAGL